MHCAAKGDGLVLEGVVVQPPNPKRVDEAAILIMGKIDIIAHDVCVAAKPVADEAATRSCWSDEVIDELAGCLLVDPTRCFK